MAKKVLRLVVDTNVWVSALMPGGLKAIVLHLAESKDVVLFSHESIRELVRVFGYPKIIKLISIERSSALLNSLDTFGEKVWVTIEVDVCRDEEDNYVLALAKDGNADLLITGDKDLLVLERFGKTKIISPAQFLKEFA